MNVKKEHVIQYVLPFAVSTTKSLKEEAKNGFTFVEENGQYLPAYEYDIILPELVMPSKARGRRKRLLPIRYVSLDQECMLFSGTRTKSAKRGSVRGIITKEVIITEKPHKKKSASAKGFMSGKLSSMFEEISE